MIIITVVPRRRRRLDLSHRALEPFQIRFQFSRHLVQFLVQRIATGRRLSTLVRLDMLPTVAFTENLRLLLF